VMGLVKEGADFRVAEHQLVHAVIDRCAARLQRGYGGLDDLNGFVAKCFSRGGPSLVTLPDPNTKAPSSGHRVWSSWS
jgi:hypothetical protein